MDGGGGLPKMEKHALRSLTLVVGGGDLYEVRKHESRYWTFVVSGGGRLNMGNSSTWTWMTRRMGRWNRTRTRTWMGMWMGIEVGNQELDSWKSLKRSGWSEWR